MENLLSMVQICFHFSVISQRFIILQLLCSDAFILVTMFGYNCAPLFAMGILVNDIFMS